MFCMLAFLFCGRGRQAVAAFCDRSDGARRGHGHVRQRGRGLDQHGLLAAWPPPGRALDPVRARRARTQLRLLPIRRRPQAFSTAPQPHPAPGLGQHPGQRPPRPSRRPRALPLNAARTDTDQRDFQPVPPGQLGDIRFRPGLRDGPSRSWPGADEISAGTKLTQRCVLHGMPAFPRLSQQLAVVAIRTCEGSCAARAALLLHGGDQVAPSVGAGQDKFSVSVRIYLILTSS